MCVLSCDQLLTWLYTVALCALCHNDYGRHVHCVYSFTGRVATYSCEMWIDRCMQLVILIAEPTYLVCLTPIMFTSLSAVLCDDVQ